MIRRRDTQPTAARASIRLALPVALAVCGTACGARQPTANEHRSTLTLREGWRTPIGDDGLSLWDVSIVQDRVVIVGTRPTTVDGVAAVDAVVRILDLFDGDVLLEETVPVSSATARPATSSVRGARVASIAGDALLLIDLDALRVRSAIVEADATSVILGDDVALVLTDAMHASVYDAESAQSRGTSELTGDVLVGTWIDRGDPVVITSSGAGNATLIARSANASGLDLRWRQPRPSASSTLIVDGLIVFAATGDDGTSGVRISDGRDVDLAGGALHGRFRAPSVTIDSAVHQGRLFTVQRVTAHSPRLDQPVWTTAFVSSGSVSSVVRSDDQSPVVLVVASQTAAAIDTRDGTILWEASVPVSSWDAQPCAVEGFSPSTFVATCNEGGVFELMAVEPRTP